MTFLIVRFHLQKVVATWGHWGQRSEILHRTLYGQYTCHMKIQAQSKKKIFFGLFSRDMFGFTQKYLFLILGGIYNVTIFYLATFFCTFINLYVLSKSCVDCKYSLLLSAVPCDLFSADWSTVNWGHFCGNIYTQIIPSNSDWPDSDADWPILRRPINM